MGDRVTITMATTPGRAHHALAVAQQLRPQCDRLRVYVNGAYEASNYPGEWLIEPDGDWAAAAKFYKCPQDGWHLTVDDDLDYPANYVDEILAGAERHPDSVVSYHGKVVPGKIGSYFRDCIKHRVLGDVPEDVRVHIPGTGCMAYRAPKPYFFHNWLEPPFMVDIHAGRRAADYEVPCWVLKHERGWITHRQVPLDDTLGVIFNKTDRIHTWYVNRQEWPDL